MQVGVDPCGVTAFVVLDDFVSLFPVSLGVVPECFQRSDDA